MKHMLHFFRLFLLFWVRLQSPNLPPAFIFKLFSVLHIIKSYIKLSEIIKVFSTAKKEVIRFAEYI